jgi:hypothetical protein
MSYIYIVPCLLVTFLYGFTGAAAMIFCFLKDVWTLPSRLKDHNMNVIWIALQILVALMMRTLVNIALIMGQEFFVAWRYPEAVKQIAEGDRVRMRHVKMPGEVSARVIGYMQAAGRASSASISTEGEPQLTEEPLMDLGESAPQRLKRSGSTEELEKSILNDTVLAWICYAKTSLCISIPILQLCVIIAARVYLGNALWEAGVETFKERTWSHYLYQVWHGGGRGCLRLLWAYI